MSVSHLTFPNPLLLWPVTIRRTGGRSWPSELALASPLLAFLSLVGVVEVECFVSVITFPHESIDAHAHKESQYVNNISCLSKLLVAKEC